MRNKICSATKAVAMIRPDATVVISGFVGVGTPEAVLAALQRRFLEMGEPRALTLVFSAAHRAAARAWCDATSSSRRYRNVSLPLKCNRWLPDVTLEPVFI
jgi:acyl CoA:acetate/3-ketoacid CoA transferase